MIKIAIFVSTHHGHTLKVANFMKQSIQGDAVTEKMVEVYEISKRRATWGIGKDCDIVLIGAPIYAQRFPKAIVKWVQSHRHALAGKRTAFFSISLNAADQRPQCRMADDSLLRMFMDQTGFVPNYVASFSGALQYRSYNWLVRQVMKRISAAAGGPTNTSQDYEMTDWNEVRSFLAAILNQDLESSFAVQKRFPHQFLLDHYIPEFEEKMVIESFVKALPSEVFSAFKSLRTKDLKIAGFLGKIRAFGKDEKMKANETFFESAQRFGTVPLGEVRPYVFIGGLIGKLWKKDFGIRMCKPEKFTCFQVPGYSKVVTQYELRLVPEKRGTAVRVEMRIHSTSVEAQKKFHVYWSLLGPGIRLYNKSILAALRRSVESRKSGQVPPEVTTSVRTPFSHP